MPEGDARRAPHSDGAPGSHPSDTSTGASAADSDAGIPAGPAADALLQQALRARVGGPRVHGAEDDTASTGDWRRRFTRTQLVLIAVICGVAVGMGIGFLLI